MSITEQAMTFVGRRRIFRYLRISPDRVILARLPWLAARMFDFMVNERIVEYPFIHAHLSLQPGGRVLDVGPGSTKLPLELAGFGHEVWAIDLKPYPYPAGHPGLGFVRGDARHIPAPDGFSDRVTAVSCIESTWASRERAISRATGGRLTR